MTTSSPSPTSFSAYSLGSEQKEMVSIPVPVASYLFSDWFHISLSCNPFCADMHQGTPEFEWDSCIPRLTAEWLMVARTWQQLCCPSVDKGIKNLKAREKSQWLKTLAVLPENLGLDSTIHMEAHSCYHSSSNGSDARFWLPGVLHTCINSLTYDQTISIKVAWN